MDHKGKGKHRKKENKESNLEPEALLKKIIFKKKLLSSETKTT